MSWNDLMGDGMGDEGTRDRWVRWMGSVSKAWWEDELAEWMDVC